VAEASDLPSPPKLKEFHDAEIFDCGPARCRPGDTGFRRRILRGAQSATTHKCSVTSKKPDGKAMMLVGTDTYKSKPDAMKAMKGMSECKA